MTLTDSISYDVDLITKLDLVPLKRSTIFLIHTSNHRCGRLLVIYPDGVDLLYHGNLF